MADDLTDAPTDDPGDAPTDDPGDAPADDLTDAPADDPGDGGVAEDRPLAAWLGRGLPDGVYAARPFPGVHVTAVATVDQLAAAFGATDPAARTAGLARLSLSGPIGSFSGSTLAPETLARLACDTPIRRIHHRHRQRFSTTAAPDDSPPTPNAGLSPSVTTDASFPAAPVRRNGARPTISSPGRTAERPTSIISPSSAPATIPLTMRRIST